MAHRNQVHIDPVTLESTSHLAPLPEIDGVHSKYVDCMSSCGLTFHYLFAGKPTRPLILLLHGYPELAYSWRRIIYPLSRTTLDQYHVVAPDLRGYGRTIGWDSRDYDSVDMNDFGMLRIVADLVCLVHALGYSEVHCLVGHDFGSYVAGVSAMARPDFFKSVVLMSHPFKGAPKIPFATASSLANVQRLLDQGPAKKKSELDIHASLLELDPPRKHYSRYNSTLEAAEDWYCNGREADLRAFLRGYFHLKSADWKANDPQPLSGWTADELAKLPHYYVMPASLSMPQTVEHDMSGEDPNATKRWLPDEELEVYVQEWKRTRFQGGLNWYRSNTHPTLNRELRLYAGRRIECPALLLNGEKDWGKYQRPGEMDNFEDKYADLRGVIDVKAGHWPQQEDPEGVITAIQEFLATLDSPTT